MFNCKEWKLNQLFAGIIIGFGGFGLGTALAWSATALSSLESTGQVGTLTQPQISWIGSLMAIGAMIACPLTSLYLRGHGRKETLVLFCAVEFIGWTLLATAANPLHLYFGRVLSGAAAGSYTVIIPMFVGEIASKEYRGLVGCFFVIMVCTGKLFSNVVGIYFTADVASLWCGLHSVIYTLCLLLIPESPKVLREQGKNNRALRALQWYEAKGFGVFLAQFPKEETLETELDVASKWTVLERENPKYSLEKDADVGNPAVSSNGRQFKLFFSAEVLKPVIIVLISMIFSQFCGIFVVTFYTVDIFKMSGDFLLNSEQATIILAFIQTVGCLPCSLLLDKYGRKVLLSSSYGAMGLAMAAFSLFFYFKDIPDVELNVDGAVQSEGFLGLVPLISMVVYYLAYSWGLGSIIWILLSEMIPQAFTGPVSAIANVVFWVSAFLVLHSFRLLKDNIPLYVWFIIYAGMCTAGFIFTLVVIPETKGLSLEEIQSKYFKSKKNNEIKLDPAIV